MPTVYKKKATEDLKIDYGTAKSHYANLRFKQGLPKVAGGDIKKGTQAYNEIVLLQKGLKGGFLTFLPLRPESCHMFFCFWRTLNRSSLYGDIVTNPTSYTCFAFYTTSR